MREGWMRGGSFLIGYRWRHPQPRGLAGDRRVNGRRECRQVDIGRRARARHGGIAENQYTDDTQRGESVPGNGS